MTAPRSYVTTDGRVIGVNHVNPCVKAYGEGPRDKTCKTCTHLFLHDYHNKRYWKCDKRTYTFGAGSDHRLKWPACGRFTEKT